MKDKKQKSENRITLEHHDRTIDVGICPGCRDHRIVDIPRVSNEDAMGKRAYLGTYHACGSNDGHLCWSMTKAGADPKKPLYETFGPKATKRR